jgi:cell wall-associated NlpC family hydrolase
VASVTFDLYARGEERVAHAFRVVRGEADKTEKSTRSMGKAFSGLSAVGGLASKAVLGLGLGIAGAGVAFVNMTDSVVGLNLQVAKARTVFGASFTGVDRQLRATASNFGITRIEALGLAGTFADMAKQTDFSTKRSAEMSVKFVELAGRVKFLSAGQFDAAQASEALSAAFRGEYDSLQRVVPAISQARVEQVAADIQKKSSTKLSDDQAKMLAVLKIVQDGVGTSNALMATEEGKKAIALEKSRTRMREMWQELQTNLLPAFTTLWEAVAGEVNPALEDFSDWLQSPSGKQSMKEWVGLIGDGVHAMGEFARSIDDAIYWIKLLGIHADKTWYALIPKAIAESQVAIYDMLADLPGIGDSFRDEAKRAHDALDRIQRDTDRYDTESAQLEIGHLQTKINSLRGKTVKTEADRKAIEDSERRIAELQRKIRGLTGRAVTITARTIYYGDGTARTINSDGTLGRVMRARGGSVYGGGTETSDSIPAQLSHNEHVVSAREVRGAGGHAALNAMRAQWRQGFADGGAVLGSSPARVAAAIDMSISRFTHLLMDRLAKHLGTGGGPARALIAKHRGDPYVWGSAGPNGFDCSGWVSALVNAVRGERYPYHRLGTTSTFPWSGFARGPGAFMVGSFRGSPGHMAATVFGLNTESTGSRGVIAGGNARGARSSLFGGNIWHLARLAKGGAVGDAPYDLLDPDGAEYLGDSVRRAALTGQTFHRGGVAAGLGVLLRGERVLTTRQTSAFDRMVRVLDRGGGAGGDVINVYVSGVIAGGERQVVEFVAKGVKAARGSGHLNRADFI